MKRTPSGPSQVSASKEVCAMFVLTKFVKINIQKLLCTVIKLHEVLYFEQDF